MPREITDVTQSLTSFADASRREADRTIAPESKSAYSQYMTPGSIARFMALLFPTSFPHRIALLDPGAGVGTLTSAFIERICMLGGEREIDVVACEIDPVMQTYLQENLSHCEESAAQSGATLGWRIIRHDFIEFASDKSIGTRGLFLDKDAGFTHCIMNPPYKKISSSSTHRQRLRSAGIETVNLYSGFLALSLLLMRDEGHVVAIVPRSFCNGPYYRSFREFVFRHAALKHIHLFDSRSKAFKNDNVLQENVIVTLQKGARQQDVTISTSSDDTFTDVATSWHPFRSVVLDGDDQMFVHIPSSGGSARLMQSTTIDRSLSDLGVEVSTGPVVDFRVRQHLRDEPDPDTVPLLYPCHFQDQTVHWPLEHGKKPNAIDRNPQTEKWLYPCGAYTVVRRFSSKEERRRIVASSIDAAAFPEFTHIGFENHLNVFHDGRTPLPEMLARGLATYLNSTIVDEWFRQFSGHTQVNATDLRRMRYPSSETLEALGRWTLENAPPSQRAIDCEVERLTL